MKTIGTAQVIPGEKTVGNIQVGTDTDGTPFQIPVLVASGEKEGPTFWVHGCIHGGEYGGAASIINFYHELDVSELAGTFVGVPVMNPPAFKVRHRNSPLDGENLNRIFPGNPDGTYSHRLAHTLLEVMKDTADVVIDLHSGGLDASVPFYMIVKDDNSDVAKESMRIAKRMGANVIWRSKGEAGTGGSVSASLVKEKIPTVTVECGGGTLSDEDEREFKRAIKFAMQACNLLPGESPVQDEYTIIGDATFFVTKEGGLFVPACKVGDYLNKGDKIGSVMNLYGKIVEELICPEDNSYIAAVGNRYWPTEPGQLMAESIPVESRGK